MDRGHGSHFRERVPWNPAWKTCRPNTLPSTESLDSDTFQVTDASWNRPNVPPQGWVLTPGPRRPLSLQLILNHSGGFGNNGIGGDRGPIFPTTESAAVALVPFHARFCCFQLPEFLSRPKLSLTQTMLRRAMQRTGSVQLLSLGNQTEKRREVVRRKPDLAIWGNGMNSAGPSRDPSGCQSRLTLQAAASERRCPPGQPARWQQVPEAPPRRPSGSRDCLPATNYLNGFQDLSVAPFLETQLADAVF